MRKILLTGPGFIGKNVLNSLAKDLQNEIYVIVHNNYKLDEEYKNVHLLYADLFDFEHIDNIMKEYKFDSFVHLAWYCGKGLHGSELNIDWTIITLTLLKQFVNYGGKTFLGIGSVSEYDFSYGYLDEFKTPLANNSIYGKAKAACYQLCKEYCKINNVIFKWARVFNLYGKNEKEQRLIPYVITQILRKLPVNVSDCTKIQDYSYVIDIANAIVKFFYSDVTDAVNICSGKPIVLKDLLQLICIKLNYNINNINFGAIPTNFDENFICGNNQRLVNEVKYIYQYNNDIGINEVIKDLKTKII